MRSSGSTTTRRAELPSPLVASWAGESSRALPFAVPGTQEPAMLMVFEVTVVMVERMSSRIDRLLSC